MLAEVESFINDPAGLVEAHGGVAHRGGVAVPGRGAARSIHRRSGSRSSSREASGSRSAAHRSPLRCPGTWAVTSASAAVTARSTPTETARCPARQRRGPRVVAPAERKSVIRSRVASAMGRWNFRRTALPVGDKHRRAVWRTQRGQRNIGGNDDIGSVPPLRRSSRRRCQAPA